MMPEPPRGAELRLRPGSARVIPAPGLALDRLLQGKTAEQAAALLPRLFNLCPMAQDQAARLALGLPPLAETRSEIIRLHLQRLNVTLRAAVGLRPVAPTPPDWGGAFPADLDALARFLSADLPLAQLAREIARAFAPGQALTRPLPFPQGAEALTAAPFENSPAGRQSAHPLMRVIEAREGRSPFWRLIGLMADLDAATRGRLPPDHPGPIATVQASRGAYALRLETAAGRVTRITRRTPTDHLMAPGGALEQSMSTCPAPLAPLLLALHDPCVAVTIRERQDA